MIVRSTGFVAAALLCSAASARGVSPYLPLGESPEIERQVERLLIIADEPILERPIAAATVLDALPKACERDAALCDSVRRYLDAYMHRAGIVYASAAVAGDSGAAAALPNRHGMTTDSSYEVAVELYWQPADYWLLTAGTIAYSGDRTPTNTMLSVGNEFAQVDVGYRDHWLSPLTDSAMVQSTQAPTMPSITVSNYAPISRLAFRYEVFLGEMSESNNIVLDGALTSGRPRLAGVHLSITPFPGWSLGLNRILQYGGGGRRDSLHDLFKAFVNPSSDNIGSNGNPASEFGNQVASFTSRFLFPGRLPLALYFEYAGEDTSATNNLRLGNAALSAGVQLPSLGQRFDLTFEVSEWQNAWYVHHIYLDGLRNDGHSIGHWGADWRLPDDGVGASSAMLRVGWQPKQGGVVEGTYRALANQSYGAVDYTQAHEFEVRYSRPWQQFLVGAELYGGRDSFGQSYSRLSAFVRF